jgi:dTDP-4-dehydrorhamnose reductase
MVVLVLGAGGQLGQSLRFIANDYPEIQFNFFSRLDLDITNELELKSIFNSVRPNFCVNASAYTAVDKSESEQEQAHLINVVGVKNIAQICQDFDTTLIHVSTDFVFDGTKNSPYTENDATNPQGVYGKTKREGELEIIRILKKHFIIRTSWLYSQFNTNFMKAMLRLAQDRDSLSVVNDQIGTPTHAVDLANAIAKVILSSSTNYGIYHYSNEGKASWYDFAKKIFEVNKIEINLKPISTSEFPTPAQRPKYSVLDKSKIKKEFNILIGEWQDSLKKMN